jgi:hypothetical protein
MGGMVYNRLSIDTEGVPSYICLVAADGPRDAEESRRLPCRRLHRINSRRAPFAVRWFTASMNLECVAAS